MTLKKLIGKLHLWLGLASGLVVFVMGITGALYVFVDEIKPIVYADRFFVKPVDKPKLPLSELLAIAQKELGDERPVTRAEIFNRPDRTYLFRALKTDPEAFWNWDYYKYYYRVYINPYDGKVIKTENTVLEFFQVVLSVHMRMIFGENVGHYVVGISVLVFVFMLLSGIVLWLPKKWNKAGRDKSFRVKWNASFKRVNYDLHNVMGFYAFLILLITALSGLVWIYDWMQSSVRFVANGGVNMEIPKLPESDTTFTLNQSGIDKAFYTARTKTPGAYSYLINFPVKSNATINIYTYQEWSDRHDLIADNYDRYSGQLLRSHSFDKMNNGDKVYQLNFDVHTGAWMGLPGKIVSFLASLICASLPVTGFLIWRGKHKKRK